MRAEATALALGRSLERPLEYAPSKGFPRKGLSALSRFILFFGYDPLKKIRVKKKKTKAKS